jgi:hypothetical protein
MFGFETRLEHIFSVNVLLKPLEVIGPLPEGIRANAYNAGGEIDGPKIHGKILPVGGDWLTLRSDGVGILDIRATIETDDGALIYTAYTGVADAGEDGYERFLRQDLPPVLQLRTVPRFSTAHPSYRWLNRLQCAGFGEANAQRLEVRLDIYALK